MYSRLSNPTRKVLENSFASLEAGSEAFAFSSGMAAVSAILTSCPGYHVLLPDDLYHGVYVVAQDIMSPWGLSNEARVRRAPLWGQILGIRGKGRLGETY